MNAQRLRGAVVEDSDTRALTLRHLERSSTVGRRRIRRIWWVIFGFLVFGVCLGVVFLSFGIRSGVQADWDFARIVDPAAYWVLPLWLDLTGALIGFCSFSIGSSIALIRHMSTYPLSEKAFADHLAANASSTASRSSTALVVGRSERSQLAEWSSGVDAASK